MEVARRPCFVCPSEAKYRCPQCLEVVFCSEYHGSLHIRDEVSPCNPFTLTTTGHMVATRSIRRGEVILCQDPVVAGPWGSLRGEAGVCLGCHRHLDLASCAACRGCGYPVCGEAECGGAQLHGAECGLLARLGPATDLYLAVTLARLLLLKLRSPGLYTAVMANTNTAASSDKSHRLMKKEERHELQTIIEKTFTKYWSPAEILRCVEVLDTRSRVLQQHTATTGHCAVYPGPCLEVADSASSCEHNCRLVTAAPASLLLLADRDIAAGERIVRAADCPIPRREEINNNSHQPMHSNHVIIMKSEQ